MPCTSPGTLWWDEPQLKALELAMKAKGMLSDKSTREIDQIDKLIELELEKLAATRNGSAAGV